ncbi:hypothetical protein J2X48_000707 [Bosea sp. BE271]|uniref:hypothetical protein n=1 Tax=Bosea TaxID=85413 RepID=UPI002855984A|nr:MULTISPECIES: hypothetical protein [Bosea]MDR6826489.1 hypothetical protein [Bosea robiniae]MDR6893199.1 hypothetical protein [Bosea sp. BE109]MDR7137102.1 hypothetical protein [Bosea sp. BE168]MDR7173801.1 hypothetical protein [Bosea sp. BE271]
MVFTPRPLQIPNMRTDYSAENSAFSNLGQTLGSMPSDFRKEQLNAQKQQILGDIGTGKMDYDKAGRALIALGDTQAGATLLGLGQKQQMLGAQKGIADIFSGGGSAAPSTSGVAPASLIQNESGGNWGASNNAVGAGGQVGHDGRAQFGRARLQDAANAGAIPQGVSREEFRKSPELQKKAEAWHFGDIDNFIQANGYDKMIGQSINGVPVTVDGMRAVAHLGGTGGLRKFIETGGQYNPSDRNGTSLMDYFTRHGGNSTPLAPRTQIANPVAQPQQPVQVAENEADVQRLEAAQAARSAPPAQVAQSPDLPPQGANAAPAQFAVPGNMLPPNDPYPRVTTQQLYSVLQNPMASDGQRAMAKSIIDNRMKYSDENAPDKREKTRLETEKLRREVEGEGGRPMTPEERKAYNVPEGQPAYVKRNGDPGFGPAGTRIDLNKGENKFDEEMGKGQAKRFNDLIAEGDVAQGRLADIQTLRETSRRLGSQGSSANLKATVGPYAESLGIKVDGLSDIQLYESITQRLAPTLRAPGSGSTSDIEFKGFLRAIGPLSNTPAAREMILDTFEAASRNDIARADIASRLAQKEITRGQAEKEIRSLPNPLEAFREFRKQNPDLVGQAIKESAETDRVQRAAPPITTADGYNALKPGDKYTDPDGNIRTKR